MVSEVLAGPKHGKESKGLIRGGLGGYGKLKGVSMLFRSFLYAFPRRLFVLDEVETTGDVISLTDLCWKDLVKRVPSVRFKEKMQSK